MAEREWPKPGDPVEAYLVSKKEGRALAGFPRLVRYVGEYAIVKFPMDLHHVYYLSKDCIYRARKQSKDKEMA